MELLVNIITNPITGEEKKSDNTSPHSALVDFYNSFNHKNFDLMEENWLQSAEASMSNPLGGLKRGWDEIKEVYTKIFSGSAKVYVEFYDYSIYCTDNMFVAVGRERGSLEINNEITNLLIRTSRVFSLVENQWKQVHHHGSMDNPELLGKYQEVLLGGSSRG